MKIDIKGTIVSNDDKWIYDFCDMEATCPKDITSILRDSTEDIEVIISSGGGDVYAGSEIYTALKEYKGSVTGKIVGIAASAASVIAMGCKKLKMSPTGQMMIHKAIVRATGNSNDFENIVDALDSHDESICNAYVIKTGKSRKEIMDLMDKETYFSPQEALKLGLIDEIMFDEGLKLSASIESTILPQNVINKIRNHLNKNPLASNEDSFIMPIEEEQPTDENREEPETLEPVSDRELQEQEDMFNKLKLKLLEVET